MLSWMSWLPPFQAATTRAPAMWSGALGSPLSRPANAGTCEVSVPITPTRSSAGGPAAGAQRAPANNRRMAFTGALYTGGPRHGPHHSPYLRQRNRTGAGRDGRIERSHHGGGPARVRAVPL